MDIERINENTVKFYISYADIEERGFDRDEIWYNRERSEELFWDIMDEVHEEEEDFLVDGPLWIQVQALDKGLEILVTKAHQFIEGQKMDIAISDGKLKEIPVDERIEEILDSRFKTKEKMDEEDFDVSLEFVITFKDFEDILSLAKIMNIEDLITKLYAFENRYYLYVEFPEDLFDEEEIDNILSLLLEYGYEAKTTIHRLVEYGKNIINEDVFNTLNKYFH